MEQLKSEMGKDAVFIEEELGPLTPLQEVIETQ